MGCRILRCFSLACAMAASAVAGRRVRREVRSLSEAEWGDVVDAMWTMKRLGQAEGEARYGPAFRTYDSFVAQHVVASLNAKCDAAHFSPIFVVWHRAFELQFENALLAVNGNISGAPYWDYRPDADDPGRPGGVFTDHYFGDWVGQGPGFEVTNGRFADWPVAAAADGAQGWRGLYGGLRGPMSMNRSPNATRNGGTMCGVPVGVGNATWWAACLEPDDVRDMHLCIDYEVHGMAHFGVGGGWPRYAHQPSATGNISGNAAPLCASFYGMVGSRGEDRQLGSYVYPINAGCLDCPDCAAEGLDEADCVCACARDDCGCGGVWTGDPAYVETIVAPEYVQVVGDMYDPISSPNDPLFFFHHVNMDRFFMAWQRTHRDAAPHYGFPRAGVKADDVYCAAHLLDGVLGDDSWPIRDALPDQAGPLSPRDVFDRIGEDTAPYEYDTLD